ncbi:hypothetical protein [Microbulbifer epialgicus]|uniref:Lipoprotein n=1 Tax=Microbulbifer epialgicus TaxID=393907 RepID=A0ABV4P0I3_9GAMM
MVSRGAFFLLVCLCLYGCHSARTVVIDTWHSPYIAGRPLGKTLVLAYTLVPRPIVGLYVEDLWVEELNRYEVEAYTWSDFEVGVGVPSMQEIAEVLAAHQFDTLLVTQLIEFKRPNRNIPNSQVAIVETRLYIAPSEELYWSLQTETFLVNYIDGDIRRPREGDAREYVETVIQKMMQGGVL